MQGYNTLMCIQMNLHKVGVSLPSFVTVHEELEIPLITMLDLDLTACDACIAKYKRLGYVFKVLGSATVDTRCRFCGWHPSVFNMKEVKG